jgi:leader peptidase (prepilin peptidase)/N-methyltransferase
MGIEPIFDAETWARVPFHFWSVVFFTFGSMVGSFLNVCIHRMPIGLSVVTPPSHCPHCKYSIPWFLNMPLVTWLMLRGKCKNCSAPISVRYFLVELLTGVMFLGCWIAYGESSAWLALTYSLLIAAMIVATFIDLEHFIIPDEITIGGTVLGLILSLFCPVLHGETMMAASFAKGIAGAAVGFGIVYAIVRLGKLMFGRQRVELPVGAKIIFSETAVHLPDKDILFEELFYRQSDEIVMQAQTLELIDRCYENVKVRLSPKKLRIGDDEFDPETVHQMEAVATEITLPREAMGFGDVKFMAAIGAFLGWQATIFSLFVSSFIGAIVGFIGMALVGRERFARIPYGPYIAAAAVVWIFLPEEMREETKNAISMFNPFVPPRF